MRLFQKTSIALSFFLTLALPTEGLAFKAKNFLKVYPEGNGQFEVISRAGVSPGDLWCAAGDYALRELRAAGNQRVYLVEGRHKARTVTVNRFGYSFSLTPPPEAEAFRNRPLLLNMRNIGDSLSVSFAREYCNDDRGAENVWRP